MKKGINTILAYVLWIVDILLAFWLAFLSRNDLLSMLALFYEKGSWSYPRWVIVIDRVFTITVGLGWLAFMVIVEESFRRGTQKGDLLQRFARITGLLILCIFVVDLILFWLQGIGSANWLRWFILAGELTLGIGIYVYYKSTTSHKTN